MTVTSKASPVSILFLNDAVEPNWIASGRQTAFSHCGWSSSRLPFMPLDASTRRALLCDAFCAAAGCVERQENPAVAATMATAMERLVKGPIIWKKTSHCAIAAVLPRAFNSERRSPQRGPN